ncbi:hypothetical protein J6590_006759 [Homalodisca vitripennis]|nr:hypothetical protein J6590_006759 [Homalodisca vitripennis]
MCTSARTHPSFREHDEESGERYTELTKRPVFIILVSSCSAPRTRIRFHVITCPLLSAPVLMNSLERESHPRSSESNWSGQKQI